jgi:predicted dehydrogenase
MTCHAGRRSATLSARAGCALWAIIAMLCAPVRVLVAGAGGFGLEHLERLARRSDVSVVGVADISPAALAPVASRFSEAERLNDPLRLIDSVEAHAIVVATPVDSHVEICARALGRGLCVLVEKPVAPSADAAIRLLADERGSAGFVLPGHVLRFSQDHIRVVEIVRSGQIGEVIYINSRRYRDDKHAVRYPDTDPVLMTLIHDIDLAQWIAESDFRSAVTHRSQGVGYRSMTAVSATTATGVICDLRTAWTFAAGNSPPDRLEVVGDHGSVELVVGHTLHVHVEGRLTTYPIAESDDPLRNEQDHFLTCVRDRTRQPAVTLEQALVGLRLADAAIESLRLRRQVAVRA